MVVPENPDKASRATILRSQCLKDKALSATEHLMSESDILKEIEVRWGNKEDLICEIQRK